MFHPIDERGSFIKSYKSDDLLDPIIVRVFSNSEGRFKFVIEWSEAELVFDRGHFAYRGYDFSAGPGGMPASPIEVPLKHRFPVKKFLDRFRESAENLDPEVVGWIVQTLHDYDTA